MKKIGVLFGQENSFPPALCERINQKAGGEMQAEFVRIDKVVQGEPCGYDVIVDRISQDVPFYRGFLKNAALTGTAVVNNPFWWSADEKFFNNALATQIGVAVPRTVLLPSHEVPPDTNDSSFRNLAYPMDWEGIFEYVGWPAYFKPFSGGGWKNVYKLNNPDEFFRAYSETGQLVMMLQEEVLFDMYFRCYSIDQRHVKIMNYEPRHPYHLRYQTDWQAPKDIIEKVRVGRAAVEQISRLRFEHGGVRDPRRRAGGDRFLQSRARCRTHQRGRGQFPMGGRSGFGNVHSQSARAQTGTGQLELGQVHPGWGDRADAERSAVTGPSLRQPHRPKRNRRAPSARLGMTAPRVKAAKTDF